VARAWWTRTFDDDDDDPDDDDGRVDDGRVDDRVADFRVCPMGPAAPARRRTRPATNSGTSRLRIGSSSPIAAPAHDVAGGGAAGGVALQARRPR
jgi:hypothetical protein